MVGVGDDDRVAGGRSAVALSVAAVVVVGGGDDGGGGDGGGGGGGGGGCSGFREWSVREKLVPRAIMANPRKFSEKIALLNQKEAQDSAAFEAIMKEVSNVTSRVRIYQVSYSLWRVGGSAARSLSLFLSRAPCRAAVLAVPRRDRAVTRRAPPSDSDVRT